MERYVLLCAELDSLRTYNEEEVKIVEKRTVKHSSNLAVSNYGTVEEGHANKLYESHGDHEHVKRSGKSHAVYGTTSPNQVYQS